MLAVELERTAKGRARLRRILAAYVAARNIRTVRYYARSGRVRDLLETEVANRRAHALIEIREWPGSRTLGDGLTGQLGETAASR